MIRATTGGVLKSYRSNLMSSFNSVNKARDTVLTQRIFNSYAEDPASAAKAFQLRKSRMSVKSQYDICNDSYRKFQTAWSCLDTVSNILDTDIKSSAPNTLKDMTLEALNDPTGSARETLAGVMKQVSESIVQTLNQKYGDNFIFAGADGHNVPFEVKDGKLYYRGVSVDAAEPARMMAADGQTLLTVDANGNIDPNGTDFLSADAEQVEVMTDGTDLLMLDANGDVVTNGTGVSYITADSDTITKDSYDNLVNDPTATVPDVLRDASGNIVTDADGNYILKDSVKTVNVTDLRQDTVANSTYTLTQDGKTYVIKNNESDVITQDDYDQAMKDVDKLKFLSTEKYFVDIGLGFQENESGNLIESSGFNASLIGLNFIGFGLDEEGDPKNIYSLVQKMSDIASQVSDDENWTEEQYDEFYRLVGKFEDACAEFKVQYTNFDAGTTKLKNNLALLEDNFYNLQEQYADLEDVDMADAITSFIWAQYCYNAALKVGNSVLSESLMDYLS